ncbi:MAG: gliding motility lipoprotein GldH [Prevotella pallens]|jgi:gliding motility-associated lipoprotein gldH|uniref:Gliding motility-associated lipoprotein GldH n=1 Tax=Prevotella pallens TaxID=60133 RepID=A0A379F296_9BACT|nr:gliding motility lipoprotein GldH [Prevotella pallens]MBF1442604.1 gliding motility lipoprotein GldH [Prevotella pallens]MBF1457838.1 gliding motility lipoprotein GldH [Prevotella pallens]MBF1460208.1 gliding motility lipoprotein GldH [Prevotella pallens]MBF1464748.1 gliding motility lipoprotein GldH [Prevotella pallens]MBF1467059.1 gliding motility lipoprotein GldH [Prevotella pallens]
MNRKQFSFSNLAMFVIIVLALVACNDSRVYDKYQSLSIDGWGRTDTVTFNVPRQEEGIYNMDLGMRVFQNYPYKSITLIVERTVIRTQHKKQTSQSYQDTVVCNVIDNEGRLVGKRGITTSAIEQRIGIFPLQRNDSLKVSVYHIMSKELLPGISDIGIQILKRK